jgi:predicted amidohydrolase YtcJ
MLIRNAQIWLQGVADVRITAGHIAAIGALQAMGGEDVFDAAGGALLPGLHDHHIHLAALAARQASVSCGPPEVENEAALSGALNLPGDGWLRGTGYHESVAGMLDAKSLDRIEPHRPVRIQHRSGRMWFLNTVALDELLSRGPPPSGLERNSEGFSGRLFDEDRWLRETLASVPPDFAEISSQLAAYGVTGITDMSPTNDVDLAAHFWAEQQAGSLKQSCLLAGTLSLAAAHFAGKLHLGPVKLHLHESHLPDLDETIVFVKRTHDQGRNIAVHCTTETELVFALAVIDTAGTIHGDRIEHAGITPDPLIAEIARLGLWVVSQPHFISERGDQYAADVEPGDLPSLYRLRAFLDAGVPLAGGSDAPFGDANPWASMSAAISRTTRGGRQLTPEEGLTAEEAMALFLADPHDLSRQRRIDVGTPADLCLMGLPWEDVRMRLSAGDVRLTIAEGIVIHNRVDQTPA